MEKGESHASLVTLYSWRVSGHIRNLVSNTLSLITLSFSTLPNKTILNSPTFSSRQKKTYFFLKITSFPSFWRWIFFFLSRCFVDLFVFCWKGGGNSRFQTRQGLDYSAALELATLGRKAKECGRRLPRRGGGLWRCVLVTEDVFLRRFERSVSIFT